MLHIYNPVYNLSPDLSSVSTDLLHIYNSIISLFADLQSISGPPRMKLQQPDFHISQALLRVRHRFSFPGTSRLPKTLLRICKSITSLSTDLGNILLLVDLVG